MRAGIVVFLCLLQVVPPMVWTPFCRESRADDFLDSATSGQSFGVDLLFQASELPSVQTTTPTLDQQSTVSSIYLEEILPGGNGDTSPLQGYFEEPENMMQGSIDNYNATLADPDSALSATNNAASGNPPSDLSGDELVIDLLATSEAVANGTDAAANALFGGCSVEETQHGTTTKTIHQVDISTCHGVYTSLDGCDFTRSLRFQYMKTQTILSITSSVPGTLTGTFDLAYPAMGTSRTWTETQADGSLLTYTYTPFSIQSDAFAYNTKVAVSAGTYSGGITHYGTAQDHWTSQGSIQASGATSLLITADLYRIVDNTISGCDEYFLIALDGWCKTEIQCSDYRGSCSSLDGVTFCKDSGAASGVADLIESKYGLVDPLCFAGQGLPAVCEYSEGDLGCYTDAQGNVICDSTLTDGMTPHPDIFPSGVDDCELKGLYGNSACNYVGVECTGNARGEASNFCYVVTIKYDCGEDITYEVETGTSYSEQCSAAIRCLGTECHNPAGETNTNFTTVATDLSALQMMQDDLTCMETGTALTTVDEACTPLIFDGTHEECKVPIGTTIGLTPDCCEAGEEAAAGVNIVNYVKLLVYASKLAQNPAFISAISNIPGYSAFIDAFDPLTSLYDKGVDLTTKVLVDPITNAMEHLGWEVTSKAGEDAAKSAAQSGLFSSMQQKIMFEMYSFIYDTLGMPELANSIFVLDPETGQILLDSTVSTVINFISMAYLVYSMMKILGQIIFACEQSELQLGIDRELGNCTYVGDYCAADVLSICVLTKNSYCCYNSPLSRIIMEQARLQLGGFGEAEDPNCSGLSIAELELVDWSLIDLSEWEYLLVQSGLLVTSSEQATLSWTEETTPRTQLEYGIDPVGPDGEVDTTEVLQERYAENTALISESRDTLAESATCYSDPQYMAWYDEKVIQMEDVILPIGGTGYIESCGTGCIDLYLGEVGDDYLEDDDCSEVFEQRYSFEILMPEYIKSATLIDALWDDHIEIWIAHQLVYRGPDNTFPPEIPGTCELKTSWCLGRPNSWCVKAAPGNIDVTDLFKIKGPVETNTRVTVGGEGEGYAHVQILYGFPSAGVPGTECFAPPY